MEKITVDCTTYFAHDDGNTTYYEGGLSVKSGSKVLLEKEESSNASDRGDNLLADALYLVAETFGIDPDSDEANFSVIHDNLSVGDKVEFWKEGSDMKFKLLEHQDNEIFDEDEEDEEEEEDET